MTRDNDYLVEKVCTAQGCGIKFRGNFVRTICAKCRERSKGQRDSTIRAWRAE
jgi:hypothetical protein